ncbi:hypothetical protein DL769_005879 [Monosporascus sp. CRB-8-3]|nr:hypothetical protein DL769_005879 [Monosporascus sp. CRB-8-3]
MLYLRSTGFLAVVLTALFNSVTAVPEVKTIWGTQCFPDKETRGNELDCLSAMVSYGVLIPNGGGRGGPTDGCREIASYNDCGIEICNLRPADTTVSYGAIIAAAQIQHSICRSGDGTTGGITLVEGFQQPGEPHSYAEIHLASGSLTSKNRYPGDNDPQQPDIPGVIDRDTSSADPKQRSGVSRGQNRIVQRSENVPIPRTFFTVYEQWADHSSTYDGDLTSRLQSQLIDRLVSDWNRDLGRGEHRSAIGRVRDDSQGIDWTLAYHANTGANINFVPICTQYSYATQQHPDDAWGTAAPRAAQQFRACGGGAALPADPGPALASFCEIEELALGNMGIGPSVALDGAGVGAGDPGGREAFVQLGGALAGSGGG